MSIEKGEIQRPESYTVKSKDTLSKIAGNLGFKNWQELAALQGAGFDPNKIRPGQILNLRKAPGLKEIDAGRIKDGLKRAASMRAIEPLTVDSSELMKGFDAIMPASIAIPEITLSPEKPAGMSESESLIWDTIRALGFDPNAFEDQAIIQAPEGRVRITGPGSRFDKMRAVLWDAIYAHKKGTRVIPPNESLGNTLVAYGQNHRNGGALFRDIGEILLGRVKGGVESPYDDALSTFRRNNVKYGFFTYKVESLDLGKRDEAIGLLAKYAGSTNPEDIYTFSVENALAGGDMHSIVSQILISLGGDYETYGKMLRDRMNTGDLSGKATRI